MFKVSRYKGQILSGDIEVSFKIDGVRLHVKDGKYLSRANKPLYNLPPDLDDGVYEVYCGSFKETIGVVRASKAEREQILRDDIYRLDVLDPRLNMVRLDYMHRSKSNELLNKAIALGYEGLVIRHAGNMYKVKKSYTEDLLVTGFTKGTGKYEGMMGALLTDMGKVGTGFTDKERKKTNYWVGKIIEVSFMEKTADNKLRHPAFVRLREDKK